MALTVYWTDFASQELNRIYKFYKLVSGSTRARQLIDGIIEKSLSLEKQPKMGPKEQYLADQPQNFRYLVHGKYKIIYWINSQKNRVEVTDVFDTQQNPNKLKRNT